MSAYYLPRDADKKEQSHPENHDILAPEDRIQGNDDFDVFLFKNVHNVILKKFSDQRAKNKATLYRIETSFDAILQGKSP
jgi:hypothetical protein